MTRTALVHERVSLVALHNARLNPGTFQALYTTTKHD